MESHLYILSVDSSEWWSGNDYEEAVRRFNQALTIAWTDESVKLWNTQLMNIARQGMGMREPRGPRGG